MNLLSLANEDSVPGADDFVPVLVFVLIKVRRGWKWPQGRGGVGCLCGLGGGPVGAAGGAVRALAGSRARPPCEKAREQEEKLQAFPKAAKRKQSPNGFLELGWLV